MNGAGIFRGVRLQGTLRLQSPLRIGSGETDGIVDLQVLKDREGRAFIPATSLAGVLRAAAAERDPALTQLLFGTSSETEETVRQSAFFFEDVPLEGAHITERDGVGIDALTGVALAKRKYDYEAVERGASGTFRAKIKLRQCDAEKWDEIEAFVRFLAGLLQSGLSIGSLSSKGFGRVQIEDIKMYIYDFQKAENVRKWLLQEAGDLCPLDASTESKAEDFVVEGWFSLRNSLIVREREAVTVANETHAKEMTRQAKEMMRQIESNGEYVLPGTTLKGVLRQRAERILRKIGVPDETALQMIDGLMGYSHGKAKQKSRLLVEESYFKKGFVQREQTRTRLDRFTGGVANGGLFASNPVWQEQAAKETLQIKFTARGCADWEAGLLLFLLKDLWTGSLLIGGEKSIGRGALQGQSLRIAYRGHTHVIEAQGSFNAGEQDTLEKYAQALRRKAEEVC